MGVLANEIVGQHVSTLAPPGLQGSAGILERLSNGEGVDHLETVRVQRGMRIDVSQRFPRLRMSAE
jgi:hypothetical protein